MSTPASQETEKDKKPSRLKYFFRKLIVILLIFNPLWSFLTWYFWPKKPMKIFIMDKTVSRTNYDEHMSIFWVFNYSRFTKSDRSKYRASEDYFGFFPVNRPQFKIKDLTLYSDEQLDSISRYFDTFYYSDAYGVYSNEWYKKGDINERSSLVYGGANFSEVTVMEKIFQQRKLLLGEFNILSSPTPYDVRKAIEDLFQFRFTGWTLRYYNELDTVKNSDIPKWMVRLHNQSLDRPWDYKGPGIVYVSEWGVVFVLTKDKDLISEVPVINTKKTFADYYKIPEFLRYPFWQDVVIPYTESNVIAHYKVHTNERGDSFLHFYKIPKIYPAVIGDSAENLRFYFAGDFSDNPVGFITSHFKGIHYLRKLFYNNQDYNDRRKFFWEYYQPLLKKIFYDYYFKKDRIDRTIPRPLPKRTAPVRKNVNIQDFVRQSSPASLVPLIDQKSSTKPYGLKKTEVLLSQVSSSKASITSSDSYQIEYDESGSPEKTSARTTSTTSTPQVSVTTEQTTSSSSTAEKTKKTPVTTPEKSKQPSTVKAADTLQSKSKVATTPQPKTTESPRSFPTLEPQKEPSAQQDKPYISQKAFIDRLVVLTKNGAFIRGRDYFDQDGTSAQIKTAPESTPPPKQAGQGSWKLIIASFTSEENARAFAAINPNYEIIKLPGAPYFRIAYKTYLTLRDAKTDVAAIRSEFPDAWLLRI